MFNSLINNLINLQETKIRLINKKIKCQIFLHNKSNNKINNNQVKMFIKIRTKLKINIITMKMLKINMIQNKKIKDKMNIKYKICNRIIIIKDKINKMHKIINNKTNFKNKIRILKINMDIK